MVPGINQSFIPSYYCFQWAKFIHIRINDQLNLTYASILRITSIVLRIITLDNCKWFSLLLVLFFQMLLLQSGETKRKGKKSAGLYNFVFVKLYKPGSDLSGQIKKEMQEMENWELT